MNTALFTVSLAESFVFNEFVEILQDKLRGTHFGSVGFDMLGCDMRLFLTEYLPSLDGHINFLTGIPTAKLSFTHERKPACIEHLLSIVRVLFRCGFNELFIRADEHGVLTIVQPRDVTQSGVL